MVTSVEVLIYLLSYVGLVAVMMFFHKLWLVPMRIKYKMSSQGVKGPSYKFIYGNTKEISSMKDKSTSMPMDMSHHIFPRILPHFDSWFRIYGTNFIYWLGPQAALVVTEPKILREIMNHREISLTRPTTGSYAKKLFGDGLISSQGVKWARQRRLANHSFHGERLKNMFPAMTESVETMLRRWKNIEGNEIDVNEEFKLLTSEVISRTAFGSSYLEGNQVFDMLRDLSVIAGRNLHKITLPGLRRIFRDRDYVECNRLQRSIRDLVMETIRNREKMVLTGNEENYGTDFLGLLVKANRERNEEYQLSMEDIIDDCKTFYLAGHGTTTLLLSWVFLLLGIHTEWQEKARKEVLQVFGEQISYSEGITKLKTMTMIINETLRLYPPATSIMRKVPREVKLGNLILPADIIVEAPVLALHHDPKVWGEESHLFKPERFSEGIAKATKDNPGAYMPFGYGSRNCVGSDFAINEAKITLAMILQRYSFTLSPNYVHAPFQLMTLRPKSGVQIILHAI